MKIGFDAKRYYHNHTGLGNYSRTIVNGLQEFCPDVECQLFDEKALTRTFTLGRKAAKNDCALLHGLSNELPTDAKHCDIPTIVTMHDVAWRTFPQMYHWIDRQLYDWKYGRSCREATRVIAISESTRRDVVNIYGVPEERVKVIYQPVQRLFYTPMPHDKAAELVSKHLDLPADRQYILNVGSINSRKNLLGLVKALERIPRENRPLLLVVGNGREYKQEVLRYVVQHGLQQDVRIETGIRDNTVLQALYTRALLMAYPSHYEGFGLPVVEAALQHCPVLTSDVSSLPEAAGPGALLCNPADTDSIYERLTELIDHPDEAQRLATVAEDYARQHFDPKKLTIQLYNYYLDII